mmetsp:Transcript_31302/g.46772  ORF Transcript_31302/g.46772 Transcript_31302/m.46772 type:complete len:1158 (-) Transcript_31302:1341-4814(-)
MASPFSTETAPILFPLSQTTYRSNQPRSRTNSSNSGSYCLPMESNNKDKNSESDSNNKASSSDLPIEGLQQLITNSNSSDDSSCSSSLSSGQLHPEEDSSDNNNNNSNSTEAAADESNNQSSSNIIGCIKKVATMICNNPPLINRLLRQTVLADKLSEYQLLHIISLNGKYAALVVLAAYIIILTVFWIPCWLLSRVVSELGVYVLFLTCLVYGGRCLLRLLAFPGTNVRVYGEIELEFARYSCKILDGSCDAMDDFVKCLLSCTSSSNDGAGGSTNKSARVLGNDEHGGWSSLDIPATYKRLKVYRDRVLGVYWQVLHCLLEENGQGLATTSSTPLMRGGSNNGSSGFYRLGGACCERRDTSSSDLGMMESPEKGATTTIETIINGNSAPFGNNPLQGDIGNMANLTPKAKSDGRALYNILTSILGDLSTLEESLSNNVLRNIDNRAQLKAASISEESRDLAIKLMEQMDELKKLAKSMRPPKASKSPFPSGEEEESEYDDDDSDVGPEAVRQHLEEQAASSSPTPIGMIKSAIEAVSDMIDPKPHKYIFGLDVIRGCVLARHRGARQFWVNRSGSNALGGNGKLDVIVIPSPASESESQQVQMPLSPRDGRSPLKTAERSGRKAVLYCNPNAGLSEVATGMGLTSGNIDGNTEGKDPSQRSWTTYYTEHGYDIYLFNYAGYGRSYGGNSWNESASEFAPGFVGAMKRIIFNTFIGFTPSSESLKADATAVAAHIVENIGVDQLIIHGESIGGMGAAGAARALTAGSTATGRSSTVSLLVCDRTFCNLNAVAQRLVGSWTGNAINLLTPTWSTDVAHDFLAARCPKVVANDASDEIIHDHSSLKSGISFAKELTKGSTNNVGWIMKPPLQYRLADLTSQALPTKNPPTWPADKHISFDESFHFAACARRLGKLATAAKKQAAEALSDDEEGIELSYLSDESSNKSTRGGFAQSNNTSSTSSALIQMWTKLSCCDGLCGSPLGASVKEGMDVSISWLTSVLIFGSHVLAGNAEKRLKKNQAINPSTIGLTNIDSDTFQIEDFDSRPDGHDEYALIAHAMPIPEVLSSLKDLVAENQIPEVENELKYVIGCLTYIVSRLTSKENGISSTKRRFKPNNSEDNTVGCFLNLHCGHNNHYSTEERDQLMALIRICCDGDPV